MLWLRGSIECVLSIFFHRVTHVDLVEPDMLDFNVIICVDCLIHIILVLIVESALSNFNFQMNPH